MNADARRHGDAMAHWGPSRRQLHTLIVVPPVSAAVASDVFPPGEPVYGARGEALSRFVAEGSLPLERST